jgi:hypothetical protein
MITDKYPHILKPFINSQPIRFKQEDNGLVDNAIIPAQKPDTFEYLPLNKQYPRSLEACPSEDQLISYVLKDPKIHDPDKAFQRIESLSRYLKEEMVGFILPEGKHWFEEACEFLILGAAGVPIEQERYNKYAEELWGMLAQADPYWTSQEFIQYLKSMNHNNAVGETIKAIQKIKLKQQVKQTAVAFGNHYESALLKFRNLVEGKCAYSGENFSEKTEADHLTIEHLFPHSVGAEKSNNDSNYVLVRKELNQVRRNIPLTAFLRGWDGDDYNDINPHWIQIANPVVKYNNRFKQKLKAEPNPDLKEILIKEFGDDLHNPERAVDRITSLSRYLKEEMVGFITPGGKEWFEGACEFLIKGAAGRPILEKDFQKHAERFWKLMAMADPYWQSTEFIKYLHSLDQNPGVKATVEAVKKLSKEQQKSSEISFGYSSQLRFIPELLKSGAYTNKPLTLNPSRENYATIEHIYPKNFGGDELNDDCNYLLTSIKANNERGCLSLMEYLMGWNIAEFDQTWIKRRLHNAQKSQ